MLIGPTAGVGFPLEVAARMALTSPAPDRAVLSLKAYRQDFDAIAAVIVGSGQSVAGLPLADISPSRCAPRSPATPRPTRHPRSGWSNWNVLCTYLFTSDLIAANPMQQIGCPKTAKTLPKSLPAGAVTALLSSLRDDRQRRRPSDWLERDRALIFTALLAGLRSEELIGTNVGDLRRTDDGAVIHVRGKGGKDGRIPSKRQGWT